MTTEQLCLSILCEGAASGYDIRRRFEVGEEALFARPSLGAIYPVLAKLESKGYVCSRVEKQINRPSRRVYEITEAGRGSFISSLKRLGVEDTFCSPFILAMKFSHLLQEEDLQRIFQARRDHLVERLSHVERLLNTDSTSKIGALLAKERLHVLELTKAGIDELENAVTRSVVPDLF